MIVLDAQRERRARAMRKLFAIVAVAIMPSLQAVFGQAPAEQPDTVISAVERSQVIESVLKNLKDHYVLPEVANEIEKIIRERQRKNEYDRITSASTLARLLTTQLREVSRDRHLSVNYSHKPVPLRKEREEPTPEERQGLRNYGEDINYGFERVERLRGNIGYIRLNLFFPTEYGGETAVAAMNFVADTEALIIDLRANDGGKPDMLVLLSSYLFGSEPVELSGLYRRATDSIQQYWTMPYVPGKRYTGKDVYVLTSKRTFSAGEAFAYDLKNLKRATVVGEVTEGAATPRDVYRINEHFWMGLPTARAVSPITRTNWEGTGVKPDIEAPAELALNTAHLAALRKLLESSANSADEGGKDRIKKAIETVQKELEEARKKQ
jgi:C-terminal processing protease CtpA/Prc